MASGVDARGIDSSYYFAASASGLQKITPMDAKSIGGGVANDRRLATICPSKQKPICLYEK